jgi:soluble lytic murein transglycosylase-like protein
VALGWLFPPSHTASAKPNTAPLELTYQVIDRLTKENEPRPIPTQITSRIGPSNRPSTGQSRSGDSRRYNGKSYSKEEVIALINSYARTYNIDPALPLRIAKCESGYRWDAKNSSSTASGVYQYLSGTWAGTDEAKAGLSVLDADANVRAAIKYIASRGRAQPWNASKHCWDTSYA